ncbi:helix-turn-helix domain-containing protein [Streptomyces halobius]|uniref:Helix-turn-helix domain-containing protein n=1 Tax=Streptomyces halobius TaxID=2879846 RepID=A0ABY4MHL5_9ACTN|nr:helix-turn-helix transcriptional regulator [Streptomyces halobius]UQA97299.1 helix-turn-helix domain-containing protein [Streptomyces halobius]
MTKSTPQITCGHCRRTFQRPKPTGRTPRYCSAKCRSASYRDRTATPARPRSYDDDVVRISRALLTKAQVLDHLAHNQVQALPLEAVEQCVALQRDLCDVTAVAIRQALSNGALWPQIARAMNSSASTLKVSYSEEKVDKILAKRADRGPARPRRPAGLHDGRRPRILSQTSCWLPGQPGYPLTRALSYLGRTGGKPTVRDLAVSTGVSTSYIYRIMSGERTPTWEVAAGFARACDADPDDLTFLWNTAHELPLLPPSGQTYRQAVHALQAALRGLRLAAACPEIPTLLRPGTAPLTVGAATALLSAHPPAAGFLRWPVVRALAVALHGEPDAIRPLWERVHALAGTADDAERGRSWPAEAFG